MALRRQRVIRGIPRASRPLTGRGRLPNPDNLIRLTPEQLVSVLKRFNLEPDIGAIERRARRAFERLERIIASGVEPDSSTWAAIDKQVEREVTETMRQQVKAAIRNYERARMSESGAPEFEWVTVGDADVCESCEPRHGQVKTMAEWEESGLPGSAALVCDRECRCHLVPVFE